MKFQTINLDFICEFLKYNKLLSHIFKPYYKLCEILPIHYIAFIYFFCIQQHENIRPCVYIVKISIKKRTICPLLTNRYSYHKHISVFIYMCS